MRTDAPHFFLESLLSRQESTDIIVVRISYIDATMCRRNKSKINSPDLTEISHIKVVVFGLAVLRHRFGAIHFTRLDAFQRPACGVGVYATSACL